MSRIAETAHRALRGVQLRLGSKAAPPCCWTPTRRQLRCSSSSVWAGSQGRRLRAVVVHPKHPGSNEATLNWDAAEALALAKAVGWRIAGATDRASRARGGLDEEDDSEEEEDESDSDEADQEDESADASTGERKLWLAEENLVRLDRFDQRFYFPLRELCKVAVSVAAARAEVLFVNATLSPTQQRHLEAAMELAGRAQRKQALRPLHKRPQGSRRRNHDSERLNGGIEDAGDRGTGNVAVFDRTRLVLAIFAQRATSRLAKLQIELAKAQLAKVKLGAAQLRGISGELQKVADALARRLPGCSRDSLLERGVAGHGVATSFQSSPQITRQKMQREIEQKEKRVKEELEKAKTLRSNQRHKRRGLQTIGLVGYTNVGKSAIVNRMAGSDLLVKDGAFVTLDIAARRVALPSGGECHILDSVGFVKELPVELCEAFQATVNELRAADLVLHIRDMSHPARDEHAQTVAAVLGHAGIEQRHCVIEVWNKVDLLTKKEADRLYYLRQLKSDEVPFHLVSARTGAGFEKLLTGMESKLRSQRLAQGGHSSGTLHQGA